MIFVPNSSMALTEELVSLSLRPEIDHGPDPKRTPLSDMQVDELACKLDDESRHRQLWVFAYGSLIWKPDFDAIGSLQGSVRGWHRSFCLQLTRGRGTVTQPGLMLALARGGSCNGVAFRLDERDRIGQLRRMIRREISSIADANTIRWVDVETPNGPVRSLVFWAGPKGERILQGLSLTDVARILARACGHIGSCAEYLYLTVKHLEEKGIRDRNLWRLQHLVAEEIRRIHYPDCATPSQSLKAAL
ncbi:gamma-glutamylcyclotransferase [Brucellaceae bacterium D45D]